MAQHETTKTRKRRVLSRWTAAAECAGMDGVDSASLSVVPVDDEAGSRIRYVKCCSCKDANEVRCYKHRLAPRYDSIGDARAYILSALRPVSLINTGQALTYPFPAL
jgi:hypothetical protein